MKTKCRGRQRGFQFEGASGLFRFLQGFFWKGGKVLCLGPWLLWSLRAEGAPPAPVPVEREAPWRIANFSRDSGVLRRRVFDVAFQADSTAWFAVSDGLYRYDGYHWRRFTVTNGLPSNFIRAVSVVRDGSLWVGTDRGAGVFDGTTFNRRGTEDRLAGPNVRRIVESSDGALWFCCDRWPDATQPGGLTRYQAGIFQNFGIAQGLPSDHLLNFFEKSNGRFLAMTSGGPAVWAGDSWALLDEPGYPAQDHTWEMAETPDGLVFARGFNALWVMRDERWQTCPGITGGTSPPFCVARDGALIAAISPNREAVYFSRWNGEQFVRAIGDTTGQEFDVQEVRAAPDGSIWAVGRGTILRWEYLPGMWDWRPDLPPPVLEDQQHRLWFANTNEAAVLEEGRVRTISQMRLPLIEDGRGVIWSGGTSGVWRWIQGRLEAVTEEACGLATLTHGVVDASGTAWLRGRNSAGRPVLAREGPAGWVRYEAAVFGNYELLSLAADPEAGLWALLNEAKSSVYYIARFSAGEFRLCSMEGEKPRSHRPRLCVSRHRLYLYGYNGLWESALGERLRFDQVRTDGAVFSHGLAQGELAAFLTQDGVDGNAAILLKRPNEWIRHPVIYGQNLRLQDGWLMVADGAELVHWDARSWPRPNYISLPTETTITALLRTATGEYWLGTSQGVLHLRPGATLPDTSLRGPTSLIQGEAVFAQALGVAPYSPQTPIRRYSFSWRIDMNAWSDYEDWPANGLPLNGLAPGFHTLEARARDGLGNEDPTPARLAFAVLPIPIQDRPWFRPVLAATGFVFTLLTIALVHISHRLRQYAGYLEEQVQARTVELRQDIARRKQSEKIQQAIAQISEAALSARTLAEFFPAMHPIITELMPATNLQVALVDRKRERIHFPYFQDEKNGPSASRKWGAGLIEWTLEAGKPLLLSAGEIQPLIEQDRIRRDIEFPETWLGVPLRTQDRTLGVLAISSYRPQSGLGEREREILILVSYPVAHAIERKQAEEEQTKLREQLSQAQKMELVGRLAGGVAHDFNNMLQSILGNASLTLEDLPADSPWRENLEEITKSALRSAELTRQLLAFARKQPIHPKVIDLNSTVSGMLKMIRRMIGENIHLAWAPGASLWRVRMDPGQLDQILINLCVNARDAITGTGQISIETSNQTLDEVESDNLPEAVPGDYVLITVSDNGSGMDEETRSHLFEPFFTTKALGKGTGLGLATVFGVVKQNQGLIVVRSEPNQGTTFRIYLPRAGSEPGRAEAEAASQRSVAGSETVLLVEDEAQILELGRRVLRLHGYTVLAASSPHAAVELALKCAQSIQLLVTDVVMPGMNGKALLDRLRPHFPRLKCLFMSGYTADVIAHHGVLEEGIHFLEKPFTNETLAVKVRVILDGLAS